MTTGSLVTALAYLLGLAIYLYEARRRSLATEGILWVGLAGMLGGVGGAYLAQFLVNDLPTGQLRLGRTILGGLVGGYLAVVLTKRGLGLRRSTGDLFALPLAAGEALGRIGCHLNGCCYGRVVAPAWWAVYQHDAYRIPTQLLQSAWSTAAFVWLWVRSRRADLAEGRLFQEYLIWFGLGRLGLESLRESPSRSALAVALVALLWGGLGVIRSRSVEGPP